MENKSDKEKQDEEATTYVKRKARRRFDGDQSSKSQPLKSTEETRSGNSDANTSLSYNAQTRTSTTQSNSVATDSESQQVVENDSSSNQILEVVKSNEDDVDEISEQISIESDFDLPDNQSNLNITNQTRSLFNIDGDEGSFRFVGNLEEQLAGPSRAQHFQPDALSDNEPIVSQRLESSKEERSSDHLMASKSKSLGGRSDRDNYDDISPLNDDEILINNSKVHLESLKQHQSVETNQSESDQNTTNDVSDIGVDDLIARNVSITNETKSDSMREIIVSLGGKSEQSDRPDVSSSNKDDEDVNRSKTLIEEPVSDDESVEADHSIEEIIMSNDSIEISSKAHEFSNLDPNIDVDNESNINRLIEKPSLQDSQSNISPNQDIVLQNLEIFTKDLKDLNTKPNELVVRKIVDDTINSVPMELDSLENISDGIKELRKNVELYAMKRNEISEPGKSIEHRLEDEKEADDVVIKSMEIVEPTRGEPLDDITEETEPATDNKDDEEVDISHGFQPNDEIDSKKVAETISIPQSETIDFQTQESNSHQRSDIVDTIVENLTKSNETNYSELQDAGFKVRMILNENMMTTDIEPLGSVEEIVPEFTEDNAVSLTMIQIMETKVKGLQEIVAGKDVCLMSLNKQLESYCRRDSIKENRDSLKDIPVSGVESSSIATSSTEYRTFMEEYGVKEFDIQQEIKERDNLIEQLTITLQQSVEMREQLQLQNEKLCSDIISFRKQLTENDMKRSLWMRDQESVGQRISEISMDLVSESDDAIDELDRNFTDGESNKSTRNSRDRQLDVPPVEFFEPPQIPVQKQIEQFQKYLAPDELRIFFMIHHKFNDFLGEELEKAKKKSENEFKLQIDHIEGQKNEKDAEIEKLRQMVSNIKSGSMEVSALRRELSAIHSHEVEELRKYFEQKCADVEKHYSEEVFSQHSRRHSNDTSSDLSDHEQVLADEISIGSHHSSPRRKSKSEILASPTHRKITPTSLGELLSPTKGLSTTSMGKIDENDPELTVDEIKHFYREKISEINRRNDVIQQQFRLRLKRFENRNADDDYMQQTPSPNQPIVEQTNIEHFEIVSIVKEYDKRLQEQVMLAKEDMVNELEKQIQALLSESSTDDRHWPPELIHLREKFTAKSQLEIAQLQIKHEEEMARVKSDFEKQMNRKMQRHTTFDSGRNLDQIVIERDNLRELCSTFRWLLCELAKCVSICEDDLNHTLVDELQKHGINAMSIIPSGSTEDVLVGQQELNQSILSTPSTPSKQLPRFTPNVTGIINAIEDPSLISFVSQNQDIPFNLSDCLEKLKSEANYLLSLSEKICKKNSSGTKSSSEKDDSCEEEDGLKCSTIKRKGSAKRAISLNDSAISGRDKVDDPVHRHSLPISLADIPENNLQQSKQGSIQIQINELKNRLLVSENDRKLLQNEFDEAIVKQNSLTVMLAVAKDQLSQYESNKEDLSEGYGYNHLQSPTHRLHRHAQSTFTDLQDRARNVLSMSSTVNPSESASQLIQLIEDFCRESDRFVEEEKKNKDDLQEQIISKAPYSHLNCCDKIDAADKQKKATLQFLEEQAVEREQEHDDFLKEIEQLKGQLREREKERNSYDRIAKEVESFEQQIKEMTLTILDYEDKNKKFEMQAKASIDKIFVLREIITELESQVEARTLNEHTLREKIKDLQLQINNQNMANESLHLEVESMKMEITPGYQERIQQLEEQIKNSRPSAEQSMVIDEIVEKLRSIETTIDYKTKNLETLHSALCSVSCSSPSEDVSFKGQRVIIVSPTESPRASSTLPLDEVQRIMDKLAKHSRAEEATVKRVRDLEMQILAARASCSDLQHERDILSEKMSEQILRISTLQSRLDEQRHRAEELHRQGTSDLNLKVYELQSEISNLKETLLARDKQISILKSHLEQSKQIIDRQEAELVSGTDPNVEKLKCELKTKNEENQKLKEKIRSEMINKLALPDLMETMLADKNEEIDYLKDKLESQSEEIKDLRRKSDEKESDDKSSARTLSDIVSLCEYSDPDIARRMSDNKRTEETINIDQANFFASKLSSNETTPGLPIHSLEPIPENFFKTNSSQSADFLNLTPLPIRRIHFSSNEESAVAPKLFGKGLDDVRQVIEIPAETISYITQMETKISNLVQQVDNLKEKLDHVSSEKDKELENVKSELKKKIDESTNAETNQSKLCTDLKEENNKLKIQITDFQFKLNELDHFETEFARKSDDLRTIEQKLKDNEQSNTNLINEIEILNHEVQSLNKSIADKDDLLSKHEKNSLNYAESEKQYLQNIRQLEEEISQLKIEISRPRDSPRLRTEIIRLQDELESTRIDLSDKILNIEELKLDSKKNEKTIFDLKELLSDCKSPRSVEEMRIKIRNEQERNKSLTEEIEGLRDTLLKLEQCHTNKSFALDDITDRVEKELNYSAQLDSNIIKAIESDELNSDEDRDRRKKDFHYDDDNSSELRAIKQKYEMERNNCIRLQQLLDTEKKNSNSIQEQDALVIETIRQRLEAALDQEEKLHQLLDDERLKNERLTTQISVLQRTKSRDNSLQLKSPPGSPRTLRSPRIVGDIESELVTRFQSEVKLLTAQNEREKERVKDIERVLEREKDRIDKELNDRKDHSERLQNEVDRLLKDKDLLENELEHYQQRLIISTKEIESLETRIANFQESETRRAAIRGRERIESTQNAVDIQELRSKMQIVEKDRNDLDDKVRTLRMDLERSAQRELKLTEALTREQNSDRLVTDKLMVKLKEMSNLLAENKTENRQMSETLKYLTNERQELQNRCTELERISGTNHKEELEERVNHLFGKYLHVESFRKALVHQKRYLMLVLKSYQESEARAIAMIQGNRPSKKKRKSFRSIVIVVIAIKRMKSIVKRWHTGRSIGAHAIFTHNIPRRPPLLLPNGTHERYQPQSPPSRDRPNFSLRYHPLESPTLINEYSTRYGIGKTNNQYGIGKMTSWNPDAR